MKFNDEFEMDVDGLTYTVNVSGVAEFFRGDVITEVEKVVVYDELGEELDQDDDVYQQIRDEALHRDYYIEIHSRDFDYYNEIDELAD